MSSIGALYRIEDRLHPAVRVVSFDVFDTLLMRLAPSEQVVRIAVRNLCDRYGQKTSCALSFPDILNHRTQFKQKMDDHSYFHEAEWTVSQWLKRLAAEKSLSAGMLLDIGLQAEFDAEVLCLKKAEGADMALSVVRNRQLIAIAVSDTWMDQIWLERLLATFDLHFDGVFSSGDMGLSKRKGTIFKAIENRFGFQPEAFVHIGDDLKADCLRPRLSGWRSIWMPKRGDVIRFRKPAVIRKRIGRKKPWRDLVSLLMSVPETDSSNVYYRIGHDILAPLLIIFSVVQWWRFMDQQVDLVYYIARDARTLLDVYDILADILPGSCPRRYIRLSRRAIAIAHPDNYLENVKYLVGKVGRKKMSHWLSNFTISPELRRNILSYARLDEHSGFTGANRKRLWAACQRFSAEIQTEQQAQKAIIRDYLLQEAGDSSIRRIGIVDSGWAATTQDIIQSLLPETELVSGMYLGVGYQGMKPDSRNLKYGLLRDDFRNCAYHNPLESTAGVIRVWDAILQEPTWTVTSLERTSDHRITPVCNHQRAIKQKKKQIAEAIRRGVCDGAYPRRQTASIMAALSDQYDSSEFERAAVHIAKRITTQPSRDIATALINLKIEEGTADDAASSIGIGGILSGTAWYPGILAKMGLGGMSPVLESVASVLIKVK